MKRLIILLFLFSGLHVFSQDKKGTPSFHATDYPSNAYRTHSDTSSLGEFQIVITMVNPKDPSTSPFACRSWLTILHHGKIINQKFCDIEPVGGCSGFYAPSEQPCQGYFLLSKFGDYQGETWLIHGDGKITILKGGSFSISSDKRYLFSTYDSDVSGITIYDLQQHKLVLSREAKGATRYNEFFVQDGKYYISMTDESGHDAAQVGLIDFTTKGIKWMNKTRVTANPSYKLNIYNDVPSLDHCNCGE